MFRRYCASCFARHAGDDVLCFACSDELKELALGSEGEIISCVRYRGVMRRLILRAKVQGDHRAIRLLTDLLLAHPATGIWAEQVDYLVAAPSSLWGRARGRLDLAALLTAEVACRYRRPIRTAPQELHWRTRKRALTKRGERARLVPVATTFADGGDGPVIGLFDDVVTTGQTLAWTRAALPTSGRVRPLTLASAREQGI